MASEPMRCPRDGAVMNWHAEKVVYATVPAEAARVLGGTVEEAWACPVCGECASRPAPGGDARPEAGPRKRR
jgi:hypothetical protein